MEGGGEGGEGWGQDTPLLKPERTPSIKPSRLGQVTFLHMKEFRVSLFRN